MGTNGDSNKLLEDLISKKNIDVNQKRKHLFFLQIYHRLSNRERHPNDFFNKKEIMQMTDDKLSKFTRSISIENTSYQ